MQSRSHTVESSQAPFAVCTVIWKNYLAHARTLAASLRAHHPGLPFIVLLADRWLAACMRGCRSPAMRVPWRCRAVLPPPLLRRTGGEDRIG
jgi:hypothetical protein